MTMGTLFQIPSPLSAPDLQLALSHVRSIRGHVLDVLFEGSEIPVEDHFCISLNHSTPTKEERENRHIFALLPVF